MWEFNFLCIPVLPLSFFIATTAISAAIQKGIQCLIPDVRHIIVSYELTNNCQYIPLRLALAVGIGISALFGRIFSWMVADLIKNFYHEKG